MNFKCLFLCICISMIVSVFTVSPAISAQINVPQDYTTIQEAIDNSTYGDTIQVAAGTYSERITLKNGVTLEGAGADVTFIDGGGRGAVVWVPSSARADVTTFSGFTVQNGDDGVYIPETGADTGIYIEWQGSATIENNMIDSQGNYGIFLGYSAIDTVIQKNAIHGNKRYAIANYNGEPIIRNNVLYDCDWGGIESWNPASQPTIRNNTIVSNIGEGWAKGVVFGNGSFPVAFENNIIAHNGGEGIFIYSHNNLTLPFALFYNTIFGNGTPHNENIILDPGTTVTLDPLLADASGMDTTLMPGSPSIDAGNPGVQFNDPDGSRNDMGAHGGNDTPSGDMTPPYGFRNLPALLVDVSRTALIEVVLSDNDSGVNIDTVTIDLNLVRIFDGSNPASYPDTIVSGSPSAYTITYTPPTQYASGDDIRVRVNGRDLRNNVMPQYGFSFTVEAYIVRTLTVPEEYTTIQKAIDAARYGDIVSVGIGFFNERITLKEGVTLQGAGPYFSTIQGKRGSVISAKDDNIIQGFTINSGYSSMGIYCNDASPIIRNNIIISNSTSATDTAIPVGLFSNPQIINNTITGFHKAITMGRDQSPLIKNNIVASNRSIGIDNNDDYGIYPILEYNNVYDNPTNYDECSPGTGDISVDPEFTDAAAQKYTLSDTSQCIDAGDPDPAFNDIDGTRNDMGAFGGPDRVCDNASAMAAAAATFGQIDCPQCQGDMGTDLDIDGEDLAMLADIFDMIRCPESDDDR